MTAREKFNEVARKQREAREAAERKLDTIRARKPKPAPKKKQLVFHPKSEACLKSERLISEGYLSALAARKKYGLSERFMQRAINSGKLPGIKVGIFRLHLASDIEHYMTNVEAPLHSTFIINESLKETT